MAVDVKNTIFLFFHSPKPSPGHFVWKDSLTITIPENVYSSLFLSHIWKCIQQGLWDLYPTPCLFGVCWRGLGFLFCFGWLVVFFSPWKETKILLGAVPQPRWEQLGWGQSSPPTLLQSSQRAVFCQKIAIGYATAVKPISLPKKNVTKGWRKSTKPVNTFS